MKFDETRTIEADTAPGGFRTLGSSKAFLETQAGLRELMRKEVDAKGFGPDDEPCEFSNPNQPHPVLAWDKAGFACDGYGNVVSQDGSRAAQKRCPCWRAWRSRQCADGFLSTLHPVMRMKIETADQSQRWALGKALERWNYKTPGLLLVGSPGCGKTLAGHVIITGMVEQFRKTGLVIEADDISSDLRAYGLPAGDEKAREARRRRYAHDECSQNNDMAILIDDFGRGRESRAVVDTYRYLIRNVYNRHMHTVITTNLERREVGVAFGPDIYRRLFETPEWMTVLNV